jgi:site-specific DNA-adenine methylase
MTTISTSYFGGKSGSGTYQTIINQIPPHRVYVELFGGMAGIYRHKRSSAYSLIIEKDARLIATYKDSFGLDPKTDLRDVFRKMEYPSSQGQHCLEMCAFEFMEDGRCRLADSPDTFIYADPPYPLHTRNSDTKYRHELSDDDHLNLLQILNSYSDANIAISTYPNDIYYEYFLGRDNWRFIEFESQTRHGKAIEQLWMNYLEPSELHDYRYLGGDYRERERITRKLKRWQAKFVELAPMEQKAMIQRLTTTI